MSWWKAIEDLFGPKFCAPPPLPPFPPLEKVPVDPVEQSCIDRLQRENAELRAQIRSMASSLGNRRKTIKRLEAQLKAAGMQ